MRRGAALLTSDECVWWGWMSVMSVSWEGKRGEYPEIIDTNVFLSTRNTPGGRFSVQAPAHVCAGYAHVKVAAVRRCWKGCFRSTSPGSPYHASNLTWAGHRVYALRADELHAPQLGEREAVVGLLCRRGDLRGGRQGVHICRSPSRTIGCVFDNPWTPCGRGPLQRRTCPRRCHRRSSPSSRGPDFVAGLSVS